jgi:hypothetical protein
MKPFLHIRKKNGSWFVDEQCEHGINRYEGWQDGKPMSFNQARSLVAEILSLKAETSRRAYNRNLNPFRFQ